MKNATVQEEIRSLPRGNDFADRIDLAIENSKKTGRPFIVVLLQIENLADYAKKQPRYVVLNLQKELYLGLRHSIHASQFVGSFQNGFGFVFNGVDVGKVDNIARGIASLAMKAIREGKYNDLTARWTSIIQQFLHPGKDSLILPRVGWSVYPRDGESSKHMIHRALYHLKELNR